MVRPEPFYQVSLTDGCCLLSSGDLREATLQELACLAKGHELGNTHLRINQGFPEKELYGLTAQIRRAAVSVPSNIAEGQARLTVGEFRHFLGMAKGSLAELETQLLIAQNLGYLADPNPVLEQVSEVARMLNGLLSSLTTGN